MIGLIKATHYYSKQAALADYSLAAEIAFRLGHSIPALPLRVGYKRIDRLTERLMQELNISWKDLENLKNEANRK